MVGSSRSGKTTRLVEQFAMWMEAENPILPALYTKKNKHNSGIHIPNNLHINQTLSGFLVLAANNENRRQLSDKIMTSTHGKYPVRCQTPLGFFQDEVILFWPLLINLLQLKAQFPVRLRPETEQELATKLWREQLDEETLRRAGMGEYRLVRRILDLLQLAASAGVMSEDITTILTSALLPEINSTNLEPEFLGSLLLDWRNWCLEQGFLTYGIVTELYSQYLVTNTQYQQQLYKRYQGILADDVQDYPAVARHLFELLLESGAVGGFSYNPDGIVRWGLGADPNYMEGLAVRCQGETLTGFSRSSLADMLAAPMVELVTEPMTLVQLPQTVQLIQTTSRAQLLRQTAETIAQAIHRGQVQPQEVAIIAPGLDAIARYTLVEILNKQGIPVKSLNDQRSLISSPQVRALLTVLAFVYPGLGRLVDRDGVAEMLVVLSGKGGERVEEEKNENSPTSPRIDPVRAGLIADYCFVPHPDTPNLLPAHAFNRWDRLGYNATTAYGEILAWLTQQRSQYALRSIPSPISLLDRAIQSFLWNGSNLPYDQLAALRELLETAQHYWEIDTRLRQNPAFKDIEDRDKHHTIAEFIKLLRRGTITANPYPVSPLGPLSNAVTLATIFQYRSSRQSHPWHFWLDTGSPLWAKGGAATLFGAPYFLLDRLGEPWTAEEEQLSEIQRLKRILADLLARVSTRLYLCHSELAVNGQEQLGPLLPLVNACVSIEELGVGS
ncbi:recombinase family protein [Calothrix rhizosoleniae]|uniref:recombinase family protein n=1 Tax=Calothrix rhizosoleniae TaxID=888997 RepID=UPI003899022A